MPQIWMFHRNETSKPRGPGLMPLRSRSLHSRAIRQGPSTAGLSPGPPRPQEMARGCADTWRAKPGAGALGEGKRAPHRRPWASAFCPSGKGTKDVGSKRLHPLPAGQRQPHSPAAPRCYAHGPHARGRRAESESAGRAQSARTRSSLLSKLSQH